MSLYGDLTEVLTPYANKIKELNGSLDEYVLSRIGDYISPNIIDGDESMTAGYVSKDGVVHSSTTKKCSDYIRM